MHCGCCILLAWRKAQPLGLCEKDLKLTMDLCEGQHRLVLWDALHNL